MADFRVYTIK